MHGILQVFPCLPSKKHCWDFVIFTFWVTMSTFGTWEFGLFESNYDFLSTAHYHTDATYIDRIFCHQRFLIYVWILYLYSGKTNYRQHINNWDRWLGNIFKGKTKSHRASSEYNWDVGVSFVLDSRLKVTRTSANLPIYLSTFIVF